MQRTDRWPRRPPDAIAGDGREAIGVRQIF
jgi:hypothetical protein